MLLRVSGRWRAMVLRVSFGFGGIRGIWCGFFGASSIRTLLFVRAWSLLTFVVVFVDMKWRLLATSHWHGLFGRMWSDGCLRMIFESGSVTRSFRCFLYLMMMSRP